MGDVISFDKCVNATVKAVDPALGLVFGWGIVCTEKGEDHFDLQGDNIPDPVMLEGTTDFMLNARVGKEMHRGDQIGTIVHSWPLTKEIADQFGIQCDRTGWMVAMKPNAAVLQKFVDKVYTGFSIGGDCAYELVEPMREVA